MESEWGPGSTGQENHGVEPMGVRHALDVSKQEVEGQPVSGPEVKNWTGPDRDTGLTSSKERWTVSCAKAHVYLSTGRPRVLTVYLGQPQPQTTTVLKAFVSLREAHCKLQALFSSFIIFLFLTFLLFIRVPQHCLTSLME